MEQSRTARTGPASGQEWRRAPGALNAGARVAQLERQRRQELLTPAAISMVVLALSGFLPATTPVFVPLMAAALSGVIAVFLLAIALNRSGRVRTGIALYVIGLLLFYGAALYITPTGRSGQLSATNFTAGNLYYFLADVLPIFASALLTDLPWPALVNVTVFAMNMVCIYILPHDATYDRFVANLGGPLFLAASITLGQIVLIVFGLAAAQTIRRSLGAASRASDLEEINRRIGERQRALEVDIQRLRQTHAAIANGEMAHATLTASSELYPVALSLNLMVDRLSRLTRAGGELRQIERGLAEASEVIGQMGQGNLGIRPTPTGTVVDGLLASLIQVQGQIATWVEGVAGALREVHGGHERSLSTASDLVLAVRQLRELSRPAHGELSDVAEVAALAQDNAEQLLKLLQSVTGRERVIAEAVARIRTGNSA